MNLNNLNFNKELLDTLNPKTSLLLFAIFSIIYNKNLKPVFLKEYKKKGYIIYWLDILEFIWKDSENLRKHKKIFKFI